MILDGSAKLLPTAEALQSLQGGELLLEWRSLPPTSWKLRPQNGAP